MSKIVVIGSGYVGTTTAAILANCGLYVVALDTDQNKIDLIKQGKAPFYELGLDNLISDAVNGGRLVASTSYEEISNADYIFSCVGTPDKQDGSSNLEYVYAAARSSLPNLKKDAIYIQKSTVPVGTGVKIEKLFNEERSDVSYVSNPEFLREGSAIADTINFDRIVAGGSNMQAVNKVLSLYQVIEENAENIINISEIEINKSTSGQYLSTGLNSAELIKVTANAFLALKISFANSIAKVADAAGADITEVMDAVGTDKRIGRAFLNAGRGYGGGCFPKDVSGLISSAASYGIDLEIMSAAARVNESMPAYIIDKLKKHISRMEDSKIAVLGLAFKAGTSDARRSPGVKIANMLADQCLQVTAFDPVASEEASKDLSTKARLCSSIKEAIDDSDAILIATDWPEFLKLELDTNPSSSTKRIVFDAVNAFSKKVVDKSGLTYLGVGR